MDEQIAYLHPERWPGGQTTRRQQEIQQRTSDPCRGGEKEPQLILTDEQAFKHHLLAPTCQTLVTRGWARDVRVCARHPHGIIMKCWISAHLSCETDGSGRIYSTIAHEGPLVG